MVDESKGYVVRRVPAELGVAEHWIALTTDGESIGQDPTQLGAQRLADGHFAARFQALARWWASLTAEQRGEAKAAVADGEQQAWMIEALGNRVLGTVTMWWWEVSPTDMGRYLRSDVGDWLMAQPD